jgi:uncharacterized alpha-E superfamily protein
MERALQMADLLCSSLEAAPTEIEPYLQVLLQIADSSITYRQRYPTALQTDLVLATLFVDETNPRSVGFQLATLLHQITRLQESEDASILATERPLALKALMAVRESSVVHLAHRDAAGRFNAMNELINELRSTLWELSDALGARYLSHLTASRLTRSW